ncbi:MAG: GIY-YIG nuclease family protein [Parcubacteria group bacterium]|nr:GIY-YIG nuclease family protein [Parcubacteria group bacterium]
MSSILQKIKTLPDAPGVYFFKDARGKILYIGKATSLRSRVRSYFSEGLINTRGPLIVAMLENAKKVDFTQTDSVLEALLLEAELIKKHKPKHNTDLKDDKSFNFVVITKEDFPRVLLIRERNLLGGETSKYKNIFGPFPHGGILREAMKLVRKIFPFRDKCVPGAGKPCFNAQIGLCPGVCSGAITKKEYAKTIRNITLFFKGRKKDLVKKLEKEMKDLAKKEKFEKAAGIKKTLFTLSHIQDVSLLKNDMRGQFAYANDTRALFRVECYDVAHISGAFTVGVMTVVEDGEAKKSDYRKFKIKAVKGVNDVAHLKEVLERRFGHPEWRSPNLIAVDGSTAQKNAAESVLEKYGIKIPIVGVVKDERHRPREIIGDQALARRYEKEILLGNSEAHRFAITYHKKLRNALPKHLPK